MDRIVMDALVKWPNVPSCTGWLLLDRRGQWRMRDEACQAADDIGEVIRHVALKGFIERNYEADASGRWFFQNGPQRVFVDLAYTPHVVRLHDDGTAVAREAPRLVDECGQAFEPLACWFDDEGNVLFSRAGTPCTVALLHDHDLALFAQRLEAVPAGDDDAPAPSPGAPPATVPWGEDRRLPFAPIDAADVPRRFGFVPRPR